VVADSRGIAGVARPAGTAATSRGAEEAGRCHVACSATPATALVPIGIETSGGLADPGHSASVKTLGALRSSGATLLSTTTSHDAARTFGALLHLAVPRGEFSCRVTGCARC